MLAKAPWPYRLADAEAFMSRQRPASEAFFLILSHESDHPRLVGGIGLAPDEGRPRTGLLADAGCLGPRLCDRGRQGGWPIARHALGLKRLHSGHFVDNPASGRVLQKLGFRATGSGPRLRRTPRRSALCRVRRAGPGGRADADDTRR